MITITEQNQEFIIKDTHRGLWYEDGKLTKVLEAGRYEIPARQRWLKRLPVVECMLVDIRERDLTIKGQEILTSDKVALRVSILVQFQVQDVAAALHRVSNYEERLYSDVQLAARRSLAATTLEEILTNRNRLSEDILRDVKETAGTYGVAIIRADVKDLIFPGDLQEIMNRVLAAERMSEVQLVEARTRAEIQRLEADARADAERKEAKARRDAQVLAVEAEAKAQGVRTEADVRAVQARARSASAYEEFPALLRLEELAALKALGQNARAHLIVETHAVAGKGRKGRRLGSAIEALKRSVLGGSGRGGSGTPPDEE